MRNSRSFLRVNWWNQESLFNFLGSLSTQNWSCGKEIRSRIARAKNAFTKRKELLTKAFSLYLKKRISSKIPAWSPFELAIWLTWRLFGQTFSTRYVNLVSFFHQCFNIEKNLKSICKSAHHHLRNTTANELESTSLRIVLNVWYTLSSGLNKITVMLLYMDFRGSYFSSCNISSMFSGSRFNAHQNKFDLITPVLIELHWLPVRYRTTCKILLSASF